MDKKKGASQRHEVLVVPDIRTKHAGIEGNIADVDPQTVVFMGGYFDGYNDTPEANYQTALWLKKSIWTPGRVHLLGGNDLHYAFNYDFLKQPEFKPENREAISSVLNELDWAAMHFHHWYYDCLLTHGGLDARCFPRRSAGLFVADIRELMQESEQDAWEALQRGELHWLYDTSTDGNCCGVVSNQGQKVPLHNLSQIHGHNCVAYPSRVNSRSGMNVSLCTISATTNDVRYFGLLDKRTKLSILESIDAPK